MWTPEEAIEHLAREGWTRDDVRAAVDSFVAAHPDVLVGSREYSLLETLAELNGEGVYPSKKELILEDCGGSIPSKTRAYRYEVIGRLMRRGYVRDQGYAGNGYSLAITAVGCGFMVHALTDEDVSIVRDQLIHNE